MSVYKESKMYKGTKNGNVLFGRLRKINLSSSTRREKKDMGQILNVKRKLQKVCGGNSGKGVLCIVKLAKIEMNLIK